MNILNRTAAEIAAAAFFETFPGVALLGARKTSVGFAFDFGFESDPPVVEILEEKMRQIVRENREIRVMEMVPFSARELLLKEGHTSRAESLEEGELVEVVRIGNFYNLSQGPHLKTTSELGAFHLWPPELIEPGVLRLSGCSFASKEELKDFLKRWKNYPNIRHEHVGLHESLWRIVDGQLVWLPKGLQKLEEVAQVLREHFFDGAPVVAAPIHLLPKLGEKVATIDLKPSNILDPEIGLFAGSGSRVAQYVCKEKAKTCLQLVGKTLTILGFAYCLCPNGGEEYLVEDGLGRFWSTFSVEKGPNGVFITASIERLVALLIERDSYHGEL